MASAFTRGGLFRRPAQGGDALSHSALARPFGLDVRGKPSPNRVGDLTGRYRLFRAPLSLCHGGRRQRGTGRWRPLRGPDRPEPRRAPPA